MAERIRLNSWFVTLPLVGAAVIYLIFVFFPGEKSISQTRDEISRMQEYCSRGLSVASALHTTRKQLTRTLQYTEAWHTTAPAREDLSSLLGQITELAQTSRARITRFDPEPIVRRETISEFPLVVGCRGTFAEIYGFLCRIEQLPQTIWVKRMNLEKIDDSQMTVSCEMDLVVFMDNQKDSGQDGGSE